MLSKRSDYWGLGLDEHAWSQLLMDTEWEVIFLPSMEGRLSPPPSEYANFGSRTKLAYF